MLWIATLVTLLSLCVYFTVTGCGVVLWKYAELCTWPGIYFQVGAVKPSLLQVLQSSSHDVAVSCNVPCVNNKK